MLYGFFSDVILVAGDTPNIEFNNISEGHVTGESSGFARTYIEVSNGSNFTLASSGSQYALTWNNDVVDDVGGHDTSSNTERLYARLPGDYTLEICLNWTGNGTGTRYVAYDLNSTGTYLHPVQVDSPGTSNFSQKVTYALGKMSRGDHVRIIVAQGTGGSLDIQSSNSWAQLIWLGH